VSSISEPAEAPHDYLEPTEIVSSHTSDAVADPVPAPLGGLRERLSAGKAAHLLSILPELDGGAGEAAGGEALSALGLDPKDHPARYHRQIARYFQLISRSEDGSADGTPTRDE